MERRKTDRRSKWWLLSQQQLYLLVMALVYLATELTEFLKNSDRVTPPWFMEALTLVTIVGSFIIRALPIDNERLRLRRTKEEQS